ncbi:MAG: tetratricopeptide repeat protein [Actinomycetota bacterium]|nr:tetratricopeptide repeat protein [Actinomycetota bacterium]
MSLVGVITTVREPAVGCVRVRLLGPVDVTVGGIARPVSGLRRKAVLAVLALRAGEIVSTDRLIEAVWGAAAPVTALNTLQSTVSYLRGVLGTKAAILARAPGYILNLDGEATDVQVAERLIQLGTQSADQAQGVAHLQAALALWRGPPLVDVAGLAWLSEQAQRLDLVLLHAQQAVAEARLALGEHAQLVPDLQRLVQQHPWHEQFHRLLMIALYRAGRQADALGVYQQLRHTLAEDLGIDPSPSLRELEAAILRQDTTLTLPMGPAVGPVPAQLPAGVAVFSGRRDELARLDALLALPAQAPPAQPTKAVIATVSGTPGVGKTTLVVHWAHRVAHLFPDGQLYVNLRGFDPSATVLGPGEAMRGFLGAFGVAAERIPPGLAAQSALYRSLLAGKRVLVVLDNARDVEQVHPLLPGAAGCLAIVTSRHQLTGLIATEGAPCLALELLSPTEARDLLADRLGAGRASTEAQAVDDIIAGCAGLPLALAITAARAATHPGFSLQVLAKELTEEHTRLDALDTGEATTSVRAVFSWSYQALSPSAARLFRLLGLHPGVDISVPAATCLANLTRHQTRDALAELTRAHLLTQPTPGRYTFHDLLRAYACHLATTEHCDSDHRTALTRLFDHYLHTATAAIDTLYPPDHHHRPHLGPPGTPAQPRADPTTARTWLDTERANLTAIITHTATHGWHTHTTRLANILFRHLEIAVDRPEALTIYTHARHAAHHIGDKATEALALTMLGFSYWQHGRTQQAIDHHKEALTLCREINFPTGEALTLTYLGIVCWQLGHYQQAADHLQHSLTICRDIGHLRGEALALTYLGVVACHQGHDQQAADHLQHALTLCRDITFPLAEALALTYLGVVACHQGHYQQAADHHQHALTLCRDITFPHAEALAHPPRCRGLPPRPLPAGHRPPPARPHALPRHHIPPRRSPRAHPPRRRGLPPRPLPAGHRPPPARPDYLPRHRRPDQRSPRPQQPQRSPTRKRSIQSTHPAAVSKFLS